MEVIPDKLNKLIEEKPVFSLMEIPSDSFQKKDKHDRGKTYQDDKKPVLSIEIPPASFKKKNGNEIHQSDKKPVFSIEIPPDTFKKKNDHEIHIDEKMLIYF